MIFRAYETRAAARAFFAIYFFGTLFLAMISSYGVISGAGIAATFCGFFYFAVVSLLSLNRRFRRHPLAILVCFFTFVYLSVPAAFMLVEGSDYVFGEGIVSLPYAQSAYQHSLPWSFVYLASCWGATWLGIVCARGGIRYSAQSGPHSSIRAKHVLLLGIAALIVTWLENQEYADVRLEGAEKSASFWAFVLFDHAYLVFAGLVLFFRLNDRRDSAIGDRIRLTMALIFVSFVIVHFSAGSKAAILVIFLLFVFLPFCLFHSYGDTRVLFPAPRFLVLLIVLMPPLFYLALIQRINIGLGITPDWGTLWAGILDSEAGLLYDAVRQMFYRLAQGGIDRFMLIYQSFVVEGFDPVTAQAFGAYVAKNSFNLVLPGTPFPEAFSPSSQLFHQAIQKDITGLELDLTGLITSLNTQPYTLFGVFTIVSGVLAPLFLAVFVTGYASVVNWVREPFFKITLLYWFLAALSSYGIEAVNGNSAHLWLSVWLMYGGLCLIAKWRMVLASSPTAGERLRAA